MATFRSSLSRLRFLRLSTESICVYLYSCIRIIFYSRLAAKAQSLSLMCLDFSCVFNAHAFCIINEFFNVLISWKENVKLNFPVSSNTGMNIWILKNVLINLFSAMQQGINVDYLMSFNIQASLFICSFTSMCQLSSLMKSMFSIFPWANPCKFSAYLCV